jgi:hypothetical protein
MERFNDREQQIKYLEQESKQCGAAKVALEDIMRDGSGVIAMNCPCPKCQPRYFPL